MSCLKGIKQESEVPLQPKPEMALALLRVQLFTALQTLDGEHLEQFKALIRDVAQCLVESKEET